jgi:hypothetical protein
MLPIVLNPRSAPSMLSEGIDTAPRRDGRAVEELLRSARPPQPNLPHEQDDRKQDAVPNEGAAHDEVRRTLPDMVARCLAEAQCSDAAEKHLRPADDREDLAVDAMDHARDRSDAAIDAALEMQSQVDSEEDLDAEQEVDPVRECGMDVGWNEFAAAMGMAQDEAKDREERSNDLNGDVPSGFANLQRRSDQLNR